MTKHKNSLLKTDWTKETLIEKKTELHLKPDGKCSPAWTSEELIVLTLDPDNYPSVPQHLTEKEILEKVVKRLYNAGFEKHSTKPLTTEMLRDLHNGWYVIAWPFGTIHSDHIVAMQRARFHVDVSIHCNGCLNVRIRDMLRYE